MVGPYSYQDDYYYDSYSPSVDCTLSLGTPSTRRSSISEDQDHRRSDAGEYGSWDFHPQSNQRSSKAARAHKSAGSHRGGSSGGSGGNDALLARRCANCDTTSTPLWRNGPRGPKSLCNACGIRYKKEERRASAAAAATNVASVAGGSGWTTDNHTGAVGYSNGTPSSWSHHYSSPPVAMGSNEYGFVDDVDGRDSDSGIQYATWHFNVAGHTYQPC